jgi:hypothetical protein
MLIRRGKTFGSFAREKYALAQMTEIMGPGQRAGTIPVFKYAPNSYLTASERRNV